MTITVTDLFCGAGGSSLGATVAGADLKMAANHWTKAIEVHQENFPDAGHDCADISQVDPRRYPSTNILIASPECTNHTSAKGVSRKQQDPSLFDSPDLGAERSRATMWDVHRFVEHHAYDAVLVENVVEASRWVYWPSWWQAWDDAGYDAHVCSINSAHTGEVAQWRDRIYVVAVRRGLPAPDLELRPLSWCSECSAVVEGRQSWRNMRTIGKWRQQYDYICPDCCRVVDPPAPPAAEIIDWSLPTPTIGERARPLSKGTMERIRAGVERYWPAPVLSQVAGNTYQRPGSTCRTKPVTDPIGTQTTTVQHALIVKPYSHRGDPSSMSQPVTSPAPTQTTKGNHGLLVPYYGNGKAQPTDRPAPTVTTRDRCGLVTEPSVDLDGCGYRMLDAGEVGRAMAFPDTYRVEGTKTDRVKLYGNAVTPPVMTVLVGRVLEVLR